MDLTKITEDWIKQYTESMFVPRQVEPVPPKKIKRIEVIYEESK